MKLQCTRTIFVVDDERIIAETLSTILQINGFVATAFTNPVEALFHAQSGAPDLLISDVMMPQLSGIELAIRFRANYPECQILLFSGQANTVDLLKSARDAGHDFQLISKPFHPNELLALIRGGEFRVRLCPGL